MGTSSTTYSSKWRSQPTKLIRVPETLSDEILAYAHYLDEQKDSSNGVDESAGTYSSTKPGLTLDMRKPVNVASVPLRSPFRYPGGKTWLAPYIRAWLNSGSHIPALFIEPFAGGGICSLTVAFERLANYVLIAELDEDVAAVWKVMLYGQSEWLAKRILGFEISLENVKKALSTPEGTSLSLKEKAFQTVLRNRVQRGGIMAPGAGLIKSGENGRGIASRWYPETLARRIREIGYKRDTIGFYDGDGFDLITEHLGDEDCFIFADPPYTKAARRLYRHWQFNHRRLFELFCSCRGDFLVSYDNTEEIKNLADEFGFQARPVAMKNTHHAQMTELLIARNLDWLPKDT